MSLEMGYSGYGDKDSLFGDTLYSERGLRFGGGTTSQFLEATEDLEKKCPGVRKKIIGEAHYLMKWPVHFSEIGFFLGIIFFESIKIAILLLVLAYLMEILRLFLFGSQSLVAKTSKFWEWLKYPAFIAISYLFWSENDNFLAITSLVFLIFGCWLEIIPMLINAPTMIIVTKLIILKHYPNSKNLPGLTLNFVIAKWSSKILSLNI